MNTLKLKPGHDKRIRKGHLWIYSNEIESDLKQYQAGEAVTVMNSSGQPMASAFVNPSSLIAGRIYSRKSGQNLNFSLIKRKLTAAWNMRQNLGYDKVCRVVHGEADNMPGLIIDRFGSIVVAQHNSAGFEVRKDLVLKAIMEVLSPDTIILADDSSIRSIEGLSTDRTYYGEDPPDVHWYNLNGIEYPLNIADGQKTGTYLDQVPAHNYIARLANQKTMLDLFSYTGGFSLTAAHKGAKNVTLVDRSETALEIAREAFKRNNLPAPHTVKMELLHETIPLKEFEGTYDIVVCDPPPLIKQKSSKSEGLKKYENLFTQSLKLASTPGLVALFSCSHNINQETLLDRINRAKSRAGIGITRLHIFQAGMDHPISLGHPETEYLHGGLFAVK